MDANESRSFLYDGVNRLTSADGPWGNVAYTYDARNNLRTKTFSDGRLVQMFVNSQNRVFRFNDTLTTGGVNRNLGYDDRGNVRNNSRQVFEYDLANQPLTTRNQGVTSTFVYDGNYKRVKQTINGETIYTVYGADGSIKLRDNITTGEVTDYVRLGGKTIAELQNGVPTYLYPDHLGTPVAGADQNRNILWRDSRTPFGEKTNTIAARENRVGYTGHIEDDALKLTYMQARYYDPVIGRFMSNDPVGFGQGSGGMGLFNRYAYTFNNPVNIVDPTGRCGCIEYGRFPNPIPNANLVVTDGQGGLKTPVTGPGTNDPQLGRVIRLVGEFHENFHIQRFNERADAASKAGIAAVREEGLPIGIVDKAERHDEEAAAYEAEADYIEGILGDRDQRRQYTAAERRWLFRQQRNARRTAARQREAAEQERERERAEDPRLNVQ